METCKLCLNQKPLINKSHILSEFFYKELYDEKRKFNSFSKESLLADKRKIKRLPKGIYESGLLCQECDSTLIGNQYENYGCKILYPDRSGEKINFKVTQHIMPDNLKFSKYVNVDYNKFKLFLLANLWRAHISRRPEFKEVNLGPHAGIIRKMIFENDPKSQNNYPILFLNLRNDSSTSSDFIISPQLKRDKNGNRIYAFILNGYLISFFVNSSNVRIPEVFMESTITENNEFKIFDVPSGMAWPLLLNNMGIGNK